MALVSALAMNAFVVSGLVKRRSELAGEIERSHEALRKMLSDLERERRDMSQHSLLSAAARSLSLATVARMSDEEARDTFRRIPKPPSVSPPDGLSEKA